MSSIPSTSDIILRTSEFMFFIALSGSEITPSSIASRFPLIIVNGVLSSCAIFEVRCFLNESSLLRASAIYMKVSVSLVISSLKRLRTFGPYSGKSPRAIFSAELVKRLIGAEKNIVKRTDKNRAPPPAIKKDMTRNSLPLFLNISSFSGTDPSFSTGLTYNFPISSP